VAPTCTRLSLCAVTRSGPARVRSFPALWRPWVDEVILAVDARAHPETLGSIGDLADRVYVVPPVRNVERYLGWLHAQCTGDWILRVDDDELPSAALLGSLRELIAEREPTHYWLPRRWPHPTASEYIDDGIWGGDAQVRLVRSMPGIWRFSGASHSNIEVLGASRIADAPLIHAVTLLRSFGEREAKVAYYRALGPEPLHESGVPLNDVYLPELYPDLSRAPMPAEDIATIEAFLGGVPPRAPRRARRPRIRQAATPDLDRWLDERPLSDHAYRAAVRIAGPLATMATGTVRHVQVELTNLGDSWWPRGPAPKPEIAVGHYWRRPDGTDVEAPTPRTALTESVPPGATTRLHVAVCAPGEIGPLELRVDMVHERVRWFDCADARPVDVTAGAQAPQSGASERTMLRTRS
jgi:hypothetical protein